jgi:hypothetical protein
MTASYPDAIFEPREKQNRSGVVYDADKKQVIFVEDITYLDDEVVAIETILGVNPEGEADTLAERLAVQINDDGTLNDELFANILHVAGGSVISIGYNKISSASAAFSIESSANSSSIYIKTKNASGGVKTYEFGPNGDFWASSSLRAKKDGSDTVGQGANVYLSNTAGNRAWIPMQLSASNHLDMWYSNGSTWAVKNRFLNDGSFGIGTGQATIEGKLQVDGNIYPHANGSYYLGKNSASTPLAWKGIIVKDTTDGNYYRIEVVSGVVTATAL